MISSNKTLQKIGKKELKNIDGTVATEISLNVNTTQCTKNIWRKRLKKSCSIIANNITYLF